MTFAEFTEKTIKSNSGMVTKDTTQLIPDISPDAVVKIKFSELHLVR